MRLPIHYALLVLGSVAFSFGNANGFRGGDDPAMALISGPIAYNLPQGTDDDINSVVFYPNPVKDYLTVRFPKKGNFTVIIYNIIGDKVITKSVLDDYEMKLDLSDLQNGLYFISYEYEGKILTKRFSKSL